MTDPPRPRGLGHTEARTAPMPKARWPSRLPALALFGLCLAGAPLLNARTAQSVAPAASLASSAVPSTDATNLLNTYCVTCHNGRLKTAGLEIDSLQASSIADHAPQWEKIVTKLRTARDAASRPAATRSRHLQSGRRVAGTRVGCRGGSQSTSRPRSSASHEPKRVHQRHPRSARPRDRCAGAAVIGRSGSGRVRQRRERAVDFAGAPGRLPVCGAIAQPACRRRSLAQPGDRHIQDLQGARAGRTSRRRPAVRFTGRGLDSLQLSGRR